RAEEEAARQRIAEEAARLAKEVLEAQQRAEEARLRAEEEARKRTEEAAARKRAEEEAQRLALEVAEAERRAEEARVRAEIENRQRAEEEEQRRLEEEEQERQRAAESQRILLEEEAARKRAAAEADRLAQEVSEAQRRADEARMRAEEEAQKRAEAEGALRRAEEEARKLLLQVAEVQRRAEERTRTDEEERKAELEAQRLKAASLVEEPHAVEKYETVTVADRDILSEREADEATLVRKSVPTISPLTPDVDLQKQTSLDRAIRDIDFSETLQQASLPTQQLGETSWQQSGRALESSVPVVIPKRKFTPILMVGVAAVIVLVLVGGVAALYYAKRLFGRSTDKSQTTQTTKTPVQESSGGTTKTEMVKIDGGTFTMGLDKVPSNSTYDQGQYPAHQVPVKSFWMDKTEVTNAEYAEFVSATKYAAPSYWRNGKPPGGQERWPVTNVSLADAQAFAAWRGKRDGQSYRLPTEEEWEYAARNGPQATVYPWGNEWQDDRANVDANSLRPVGSYPLGASRSGVLDLIGNVWEWTSTSAAPYPGNTVLTIAKGQMIIRGGAYVENSRGPDAITATRRSWVPPTDKEAAIGFRLVRDVKTP
ncbi:MAG TPA: SUMF1/EgtB/PvdO family nonheme iron enzyme, partial [Blastocatellia bacterium]|nr:SUMF1/EgtB/PvdO family nonheme iron enzyme [Blastocatellia bacterium]